MDLYKTNGVCCKEIKVEVQEGIVKEVDFESGCPGNLIGIKKLVENREVSEVVSLLKGTTCKSRPTSCPDQLALALEKYL